MLYMRSIPGEGGTARKVPVKDSSVPRLFGGSLIDYVQVRVLIGIVLSWMLFCACYNSVQSICRGHLQQYLYCFHFTHAKWLYVA